MTKNTKKMYTQEFKNEVVNNYKKDGIESVVKATGIAPSTVYAWAKKAKVSRANLPKAPKKPDYSDHNKIAQFEGKIKLLEEENAFLKKLVDYFR